MQIYRGMDIGTGASRVRSLVPHHGFDLVDRASPLLRGAVPELCARSLVYPHRRARHASLAGTPVSTCAQPSTTTRLSRRRGWKPVRERYQALAREQPRRCEAAGGAGDEASASAHPRQKRQARRARRAAGRARPRPARERRASSRSSRWVPAVFFPAWRWIPTCCARIDARVDAMVRRVSWRKWAARQGLSRRRDGAAGYRVQGDRGGSTPSLTRLWSGSSWPRPLREAAAPWFRKDAYPVARCDAARYSVARRRSARAA